MPLIERCEECEWREVWPGGKASEDPAVEHAENTGHEVRTSAGPKPEWARSGNNSAADDLDDGGER